MVLSSAELISTSLIILAAIVFVILERIFPYTKGSERFLREGFFDDFAMYTIAQNYILSIIIFGVIIHFIDNSTGISSLQIIMLIFQFGYS